MLVVAGTTLSSRLSGCCAAHNRHTVRVDRACGGVPQIKERAASAWCFTQFQMIAQVESRENHQKKEGDVGRFCRNFLRCASGTVVVVAVVMVTGLLLFWVDDNDVA